MTELEERTTTKRTTESADDENLPSLFGRLSDDVTKLLDLRIDLLKVEIKEEVNAYVRGLITIMIGVVVAAVGLALANVALAFFVSTLFADSDLSQPAKYGLGFILTGIVYLLIGIGTVVVSKNRLARLGLVPERSVREFEKDKEVVKTVFES